MTTTYQSRGLIRVHTGKGKGKTTAALGCAFCALSRGEKVFVIQFLKGRETGESLAAQWLAPNLSFRQFGRIGFVHAKTPAPLDLTLVQEAWALAKEVILAGEHDLVILDEVIRAMAHGFISLSEVMDTLRLRPPGVGVILTGRQAPQELIDQADIVTEMHPVKHYYKAGVCARKGIEW